jgi:hypothetical protein
MKSSTSHNAIGLHGLLQAWLYFFTQCLNLSSLSSIKFREVHNTGYLVHRFVIIVHSLFSFVIAVAVIAHIYVFVLFVFPVVYIWLNNISVQTCLKIYSLSKCTAEMGEQEIVSQWLSLFEDD